MNKSTKGTLAIGAAVVLLLGGASSIAYWQSSASTQAADFTMGTLAVEATGDGVWTRDDEEIVPGDVRLIPGESVLYTQTFEVEVSGDNLLVTAEIVNDVVTPSGEWSHGVSSTVWMQSDDGVVRYIQDGVYEVTKSGTVTVLASVWIPDWEEEGKGATIAVDNGSVMLHQVTELPVVPPCSC